MQARAFGLSPNCCHCPFHFRPPSLTESFILRKDTYTYPESAVGLSVAATGHPPVTKKRPTPSSLRPSTISYDGGSL